MQPITSAKEWKKKTRSGEQVTLPTGAVVLLKKPNLIDLARNGQIPNLLASFALQGFNGPEKTMTDIQATPKAQLLQEFGESLASVCKASFISPRITPTGEEDDAISLSDIDMEDQIAVLGWVMGVKADALSTFLAQGKDSPVEPSPNGGDVPPEAESDIWNVRPQ